MNIKSKKLLKVTWLFLMLSILAIFTACSNGIQSATSDWLGLSKVNFGDAGTTSFTAKVSSDSNGNVIKMALDSADGPAVGYVKVLNTGSANKVEAVTVKIKKITGVHNLFFIFAGKGFQFDSWKFKQ